MSILPFRDEDSEYFKDVVYLVEANSYEKLMLWGEYYDSPTAERAHCFTTWEQESSGWGITVGFIEDMPVCVSISYAKLNGKRVMFYTDTSTVVDHRMIEKWLRHFTQAPECNAMNFHHCLHHIQGR